MFELVLKSNFEVLECNFDDIENKLKSLIDEKYNIVVTEDTVKEAKNTRAEINKGKKALEQVWREKKQELESPIKALNDRAKQVFSLCDDAIKNIDLQVSQFEAKKRELAVSLCEEYKNKLCLEKGIPSESIYCGGLNNLSYVTEKGALSSQGKQVVEGLVNQKMIEIQEQKQRELERELEIAKIKQEAVREYQESKTSGTQEQMQEQAQEEQSEVVENDKQQSQEGDSKKTLYKANVTFCVSVNGDYNEQTIEKVKNFFFQEIKLNQKLNQALQNIEIVKV